MMFILIALLGLLSADNETHSPGKEVQQALSVRLDDQFDYKRFARVVGTTENHLGQMVNVADVSELNSIAEDLQQGFDADKFRDQVLGFLHVNVNLARTEAELKEGVSLGTRWQRDALIRRTWSTAITTSSLSATQRKCLARAALLLAFADLFSVSPQTLQQFDDAKSMREIAQLSDDQAAAVGSILEQYGRQKKLFLEGVVDITPRLDAIIAGAPETLNQIDLKNFLDDLKRARENTLLFSDASWIFANFHWRLHCLAKARSDNVAVNLIKASADQMAEESKIAHPHASRWIRESVTIPGPEPKSSGGKIIRNPDDAKPRN